MLSLIDSIFFHKKFNIKSTSNAIYSDKFLHYNWVFFEVDKLILIKITFGYISLRARYKIAFYAIEQIDKYNQEQFQSLSCISIAQEFKKTLIWNSQVMRKNQENERLIKQHVKNNWLPSVIKFKTGQGKKCPVRYL